MAQMNITVFFFICISSTIIVSAIKNENLASTLDEGVKIIDDIKDTELALTIYRAQMLLLGYRISNEMEKLSEKLKSGDATEEELDQLDTDMKALINQVHLVENTESSLIDVALTRIFPTADKAQEEIKAIKS